jgi:hypothetical protein
LLSCCAAGDAGRWAAILNLGVEKLMRVMGMMLLTCVIAAGQTSNGLRQKYGTPISETFKVRPEVIVTVSHAKTGEICEMLIAPQLPSTPIKSSGALLKSKLVNEIIDELVPARQRGKLRMGSFLNLMCLPDNDCAGTGEDYERVYIYRNGSIDAHRYSTIQWKGSACK